MPFVSEYKCSECGEKTPVNELLAKRVIFRQMGDFGRTVKGRVVAWLCPSCLEKDPVWRDESRSSIQSTAMKRVKVNPPGEPVEVRSMSPIEPREEKPSDVPFPV